MDVLLAQSTDSVLVARINFGGNGGAPGVAGWSDVNPWKTNITGGKYNDVTYTLAGNDSVSIVMHNNTDDHWGFQGQTNAHTGAAGYMTGGDSGIVPDLVLDHYWFLQNDSATVSITGSAIEDSEEYSDDEYFEDEYEEEPPNQTVGNVILLIILLAGLAALAIFAATNF